MGDTMDDKEEEEEAKDLTEVRDIFETLDQCASRFFALQTKYLENHKSPVALHRLTGEFHDRIRGIVMDGGKLTEELKKIR